MKYTLAVKKIYTRIFKSDFNKNVIILSSGTAISQIILVLISPVLTRLYTPEVFGSFAIFLSVTAIIGGNINLKFEQAIMLPDNTDDAYKIAYLSNYLNLLLSACLFFLIVILYNPITEILKIDRSTSYWLYIVPLATYFIGFNSVLVNLNNRMKNYKTMSGSVIAKNGAMTIVQLLIGFTKFLLNSGLIIGQMVAYLFGNRVLRLNVSFSFKEMSKLRYNNFKTLFQRYKDFPKFAFPAGIINAASLNLSNILITGLFSISNVGYFSLANRMLGAPSELLGQNISKVYYKSAVDEIRIKGNCFTIFKSTLKKLILLALPIYITLFFFSEYLFPLIFGNDWIEAGIVAKYLSILVFVRFISSALSPTLNAVEKQKLILINNIILLVGNFIVIGISLLLNFEFISFIILYSLLMAFLYLYFLLTFFFAAKRNLKK